MPSEVGIVYKYFDLIDGFIRVRVLPPDELIQLPVGASVQPPDRREYRRLVVETCVLGLGDSVLPRVQQIYPEDAGAAEDLLYQICVDVNPKLEIHTVALPADDAAAEEERDPELDAEFRERAAQLEERLLETVYGQDENVARVCRSVRKAACGLNDPLRPIATYLLVGRSGTGKTELAKTLARHLYGRESLVRVDCSEYALPHETAKLIGAPPGYVGHNEGGTITEALMRNPRALVLFDEVEKGHEKLHNMLLQILDEGRLTDSKGNTVSFRESVVLMTSNVGTSDYAAAGNRVGFGRDGLLADADFDTLTNTAVRSFFKPEFLNRLDGILTFSCLDETSCTRVAEKYLKILADRMHRAGVRLHWTRTVAAALADEGFSEEYGAREIRRAVDQKVEEPLATGVLDGHFRHGDRVHVRLKNGNVVLERRPAPARRRQQAS